jgi:hypothetical protein
VLPVICVVLCYRKNQVAKKKAKDEQLRERVKNLDLPQTIDEADYFEDRLVEDRAKERLEIDPKTGAAVPVGAGVVDENDVEMARVKATMYFGPEEEARRAREKRREAEYAERAAGMGLGIKPGKYGGAAAAAAANAADGEEKSAEPNDMAAAAAASAAAAADDNDDVALARARAMDQAAEIDAAGRAAAGEQDSDDDDGVAAVNPDGSPIGFAAHQAASAQAATARRMAAASLKKMTATGTSSSAEALRHRRSPEEDESVYDREVARSKTEWAQTRDAVCTVQ